MCRHVYNLLPYEISHAYVHWTFVIRNGNQTKYFYCRHLYIAQSKLYVLNKFLHISTIQQHTAYFLQDVWLTPQMFACPPLCYYQVSAIEAQCVVVPPPKVIILSHHICNNRSYGSEI
jgi:hypothetical protein